MEITQEAVLLAVVIFSLRIINSAVGTVRLVVMARGRHLLSAVLGFFEALIFAFVAANVITDLANILNLVAYCGGFAVGIYVGMILEARFVTGYIRVNIITQSDGHEIAKKLREIGHGVTEVRGEGASGQVMMLSSVVHRIHTPEVLKVVYAVQPNAFVTLEEMRSVQHGWLRELHHMK